ncbi:MAG TPA: UDP-N-acetylglucosamine 1-carboxyvinyltransferase, partial [Patescibacteria group bacterium]|nr:UDP-N-acetylglucosamine 1-carboxyvinyltransferase [Patescibacteria group bacterium]
ALKLMVAACLTNEEVIIDNIPLISDLMVMAEIIEQLGGKVKFKGHTVYIKMEELKEDKITLEKAVEIRTSFMFLSPLLARRGKAVVPNPGGCRIGARPIDRVINGLKKLGVSIKYNHQDGYFYAKTQGLVGKEYKFEKNTHTGTETVIIAAVLAKGITVLNNAAEEPEVDELINFLNSMGAKIRRIKPRTIRIEGVKKLHGTRFKINSDRNEVVTFAIAALMTEGEVFIKNTNTDGLKEFLAVLKKTGGGFEEKNGGIRFYYKSGLNPVRVATSFYPGFMTDWQGPWAVLMTRAKGKSIVHETVYENRFSYVDELEKMGAELKLFNPEIKSPSEVYNFNITDDNNYFHALRISGPSKLHNAILNISDLRAGATLVLAALSAEGESVVFGLEHLDRGYEEFDKRLRKLGANIKRVKD